MRSPAHTAPGHVCPLGAPKKEVVVNFNLLTHVSVRREDIHVSAAMAQSAVREGNLDPQPKPRAPRPKLHFLSQHVGHTEQLGVVCEARDATTSLKRLNEAHASAGATLTSGT